MRARLPLAAAALALAALLAGCAAAPPPVPLAEGVALPRVAVVPFENLSVKADAGDVLTRLVFVQLARTGACEVIESGSVDPVLASLRIRPTSSLSREQLAALGDSLRATHVLLGSVLESGTVRTPDGDVPSLSLALKLLRVEDARVVWAKAAIRTGEDHETVFGWGRIKTSPKLAEAVLAEAFKNFRIPAAQAAPVVRKGEEP